MSDRSDHDQMHTLFARVDQVRVELQHLNRRTESSATHLLELREEREALEYQLEQLLGQIGAATYDAQHLSTVEYMARESSGSASRDSVESEDEAAGDVVESVSQSDADIDTFVETDSVATAQSEPSDSSSNHMLKPSKGELSSGSRQPRQSTHDIYLKTAKLLPSIKSELGSPPSKIESYADVVGELGMLHRAAQPEQLEMWAQLPDEIQRTLASYVAARVKHLQEEVDASLSGLIADDDRVLEIFSRLYSHMKTQQPGYAHGLARDHQPESGTWSEDTAQYKDLLDGFAEKYYGDGVGADEDEGQNPEVALNEIESFIEKSPELEMLRDFVSKRLGGGLRPDDPRLVKLLEPFEGAFEGNEFRKLRVAFETEDGASEDEQEQTLIPEDWPWREKLRRSRVVMIGGDARPDAQARLEDALQPASFEWPSIEQNKNMRLVQSWSDRIKRGSVDIVILLTNFISHKVSGMIVEAVKDAPDVSLVYIDRGYGVTQIQRGIENFVSLDELVELGG
jgi:hypothetical protein